MPNTLLSKANTAFREYQYDKAKVHYAAFVSEVNSGKLLTPPLLYGYAITQLECLERIRLGQHEMRALKNVVITSANAKFFAPLLMLVESLIETSFDMIDEIMIYDFGLEAWQVDLISAVSKVTLFSFQKDKLTERRLARFDPADPKTYFFKVYAFHFWRTQSRYAEIADVNALWIDSGICVKKSLAPIFSLIDHDGCFFVDHADVDFYYKDAQNLVVNILAPALEKGSPAYTKLTAAQMLKPYIKANFFGLRTGGPYARVLQQHLDLCLDTDVLLEPRDIRDVNKMDHWRNTTEIAAEINKRELINSGRYLHGRHEQAVWSYLVARENMPIHNTLPYNYTVAPGSGSITDANWGHSLRPKLRARYEDLKADLKDFIDTHAGVDGAMPVVDTQDREAIIQTYLSVAKENYLTHPLYANIGFPKPVWSQYSSVLLHRGSASRVDQHKYSGRLLNSFANVRDDIFVLLGNGPSLADVDLQSLSQFDTFGLNAAYRAYPRIKFWPKYFGCFDALVCNHHAEEFKKLIHSSPMEKFFFINFDDKGAPNFPELEVQQNQRFQRINFQYRTVVEKNRLDIISTGFDPFIDMRTSGSNSIQVGLLMGYRKFILLGVDQNYVEVVDGAAKDKTFHKLVMTETPKENPNYWFSDYQVKGDKFNRPNLEGSQIPAWNNLALTLQFLGIRCEIFNCSPITRLDCFKKATLDEAVRELSAVPARRLTGFQSTLSR